MVLKNAPGASQGSSVDVDYMIVTAGDGNDQYVRLKYRDKSWCLSATLRPSERCHKIPFGIRTTLTFSTPPTGSVQRILATLTTTQSESIPRPRVATANPGHRITYTQGASATVTFEGNAISLFGTVNTDHGVFSVSIDGGAQTNFDGIASEPRFQTLLVRIDLSSPSPRTYARIL